MKVSVDTKKIEFNARKSAYLKQKEKILIDQSHKDNFWNLSIPLDLYTEFNLLDNQNKLNLENNLFDYLIETNKKPTPEVIYQIHQLFKS